MWAVIKGFFTANALRVVAAGAFIASVLAALFAARQSGKSTVRVEVLEKQAKNMEKAHEIENKNRAHLRDGDAGERLRGKWSRD